LSATGDRPAATGDSISRNAAFGFAGQVATGAFTAALVVVLSRELGPDGYGTLALALGITGMVMQFAEGGTAQAAARFIAERHGDPRRIAAVVGMALRYRILTALAITVALIALADPIANLYDAPELVWPLRVLAVAFFGQNLTMFARTQLVAMRSAGKTFALLTSESAVEFTASVSLVVLGAGVTGAAAGRAVGYLFGTVLGIVLMTRLLRHSLLRAEPSPVSRREFLGYAGAMTAVGVTSTIFNKLDVLLLGAYVSTAAVGIYSAPLRLVGLITYPGRALSQGIAPRLARHPDQPQNVGALERGMRYIMVLQAVTVAYLLVWAEPIVTLTLGDQFLESAEVLRALAPVAFLAGLAPMVQSPLNYAGVGSRRIPVGIATIVVTAAIDVILIPEIGILGAAVGNGVGSAVYIGWHLWLCHTILGLPLRRLALSAVRGLLAAAAVAGVLALLGTSDLSALDWVVGVVAGLALFVALLRALGELSAIEVRWLIRRPFGAQTRT
jgi:O-antigen/teichoic acid export membrane protein